MTDDLLVETVERLLADNPSSSDGIFDGRLWDLLAETGLTTVGVPEADGGAGGSVADAAAIVRLAARHAVPLPLAETMLVASSLGVRGRAPDAVWTVAVDPAAQLRDRANLRGVLPRVPFARDAGWIAIVARDGTEEVVVAIPMDRCRIVEQGTNLAGEPRDTVVCDLDGLGATDVLRGERLGERARVTAAAARALQIAGALEAVLDATVRFASEREQFGRPIGRFQAVQQQVAELAAETAAASIAADNAVALLGQPDLDLAAAAAKVRAGIAATIGSRIAHQVHGAIGFTQEHSLHRFTRRLWSWRDEWGSEAYWSARLGRDVLGHGADELWPSLTR